MRAILRQLGWLLLALLALYALILAVTLLLVPRSAVGDRLNTARASSTLFLTEPKYVLMTRGRLDTDADKVILLGASNTLAGFKQPQVQALLPELEVHNLAVGGSNITQISQIVDLIDEVQTPAARRRNIYVIGLWYGVFVSDRARWYTPDRHGGDTDIDIERYRYGFYRRTDQGPVAVLPPRELQLGITLIHPCLVLDLAARRLTEKLRRLVSGKAPELTDAQRNAIVLSDAQRSRYLAFWRDYTGNATTLDDASFATLQHLAEHVAAEGGELLLVDLPIPQWHAQGSVLESDYRRRLTALRASLSGQPRVHWLTLQDAGASDDFSDEVHPKPRVTPRWAGQLAQALLQLPRNPT
ncbi:MAG: hypothetical protein QM718_06160 [Steroidobacteraceae bacterium]